MSLDKQLTKTIIFVVFGMLFILTITGIYQFLLKTLKSN
jgi:hypothetical protein